MRLILTLILFVPFMSIFSEDWNASIQASLAAAQQDPSWTWREARIQEITQCYKELNDRSVRGDLTRFPKDLQDRINELLNKTIVIALTAPKLIEADDAVGEENKDLSSPTQSQTNQSIKPYKKRLFKQSRVSDTTSFLIRALIIMHENWDPNRYEKNSDLSKRVIERIHQLMAKIDDTTTRRLEANLNAIALGKTVPHRLVNLIQSLAYFPDQIYNTAHGTNDLNMPWSNAARSLASQKVDKWFILAENHLAMENFELLQAQILSEQEDQLMASSFLTQPMSELVQWEEQAARNGKVPLHFDVSPIRTKQLEQFYGEIAALAPTELPKTDVEALIQVERIHLAIGLSKMADDFESLVNHEAQVSELERKVRSMGKANEERIKALLSERDAQVDKIIQVGRDRAAVQARRAMLAYKEQQLDDESRHIRYRNGNTIGALENELGQMLYNNDKSKVPDAAGVPTDVPGDFKKLP